MEALGAVLGYLLLGGLLGGVVMMAGIPGFFLLEEYPWLLGGDSSDLGWVQIWEFEESAPGSGDEERLTLAVADAGLSGRWIFEESSGRLALDCGDDCFRDPLGGLDSFAAIFLEHGYRLEEDKLVRPDHRGGLRGSWAPNLLGLTWIKTASCFGLLGIAWTLRRDLPRKTRAPSSRLSLPRAVALGVALGGGLALVGIAPHLRMRSADLVGPVCPKNLEGIATAGVFGFSLAILAAGILVPLAEEFFFRGWALPYLDRRAGTTVAYLGSASIWAAFHLDLVQFPVLLLMGLALAWAYRRWGSMLVPVAAHGTVNVLLLVHLKLATPPF